MKDVEMANKSHTDFDNHFHFTNTQIDQNKYYVEFNRLLNSNRCIYFYIFLIISSITIFSYSLLAYFFQFDELPIVICESILIVVITVDMFIRIYVSVSL